MIYRVLRKVVGRLETDGWIYLRLSCGHLHNTFIKADGSNATTAVRQNLAGAKHRNCWDCERNTWITRRRST